MSRLETWLDSMHLEAGGPAGYGGPVVHWWRDSILFCGAGFDWRYEGIIEAYLALFRGTRQERWLAKARRAADELVAAQLPAGNYCMSGFEDNPATEGTPHEAAADAALVALAVELRREGRPDWCSYAQAARLNLEAFWIGRLWDEDAGLFRDDERQLCFVPNKAATLVEALIGWARLTGDDTWLTRYVRPTLQAIARHQLRTDGPLDGAIAQSSVAGRMAEKYFPFYIARCIPALVLAAGVMREPRWLDAALAAGAFLLRWRDGDGAFPQVIYGNGKVNRYPRWIAGIGDVLRALELLAPHGLCSANELECSREWLLAGQEPSGAFRSAEGFGSQVSQKPPDGLPDARDLLPVTGWNDKAFRYLAGHAEAVTPRMQAASHVPCRWHGTEAIYRESAEAVIVTSPDGVCYQWVKGQTWATMRAGAWR